MKCLAQNTQKNAHKKNKQTIRMNKNLNVNIMSVDVSAYFIQHNEQDFVVIKC